MFDVFIKVIPTLTGAKLMCEFTIVCFDSIDVTG